MEDIESRSEITQVQSMEYIKKLDKPEKRFCEFCCQEQPYRTKHCKDCGECVRKYDHHCFWIGGCVGELNHRKFWAFLFFQTLLLLVGFDLSMSGYYSAGSEFEAGSQMLNKV